MPDTPDLRFPPPSRRGRRLALVASVLAHVLLIAVWRAEPRDPVLPPRERLVVLPEAPSAEREVPLRFERPRPEPSPRPAGRPARPAPRVQAPEETAPPPVEPPRVVATEVPPVTPADSVDPRGARPGGLAPRLGQGTLWVEPLPLPPGELAGRLAGGDGKTHAQLVDSAVTAIVQAYLDSLARDPSARGFDQLPRWATKIAGREFAIDAKYITVAGLRIPTAVVGLISSLAGWNLGGANLDRQKAAQRAADMRADIEYHAQRAQNFEDFKKAIREIRDRKREEQEFRRAQRTPPPDSRLNGAPQPPGSP